MKRINAAQLQHNFDPSQVLYLVGDINYSTVYLLNGKSILTSRTLKWYSDRWPLFIRTHKGYLVNPKYIHSCRIVSSINAHLTMQNGARLPIGRRRIWEVVQKLGIVLPTTGYDRKYVIQVGKNSFAQAYAQVA